MVCFAALERNFVSPFQDASHRLFDLAPVKLANLSAIFITDTIKTEGFHSVYYHAVCH